MSNSPLKDFASGVLFGTTPGVTRPTVKAPSPFDDEERMDISDRFRPTPDYTNPASYSSAGGGSSDDGGGTGGYSGSLNVTGMSGYVDDNFVGMDKYLGAAISPLGFNPLIAAGSAISKKNLQNIQMSMLGGEKGYSVGMVNGKIVGVSPGPFGGYVLSGVLPEGMTADQRRKLINDLLDLNPTTEVAGGKLDPDGPSSGYSEGTATDDVIELIESGVPPEAAAYDYTGFLDDSENAVADTGAGFTGRPDDAAGPTSPVSPSYAGTPTDPYGGPGQPGSSAPSPTSSNGFVTDPKILDALTNPDKYNEDLIDSSGPYGTVDDPTATVSLTTVTDASPPSSPSFADMFNNPPPPPPSYAGGPSDPYGGPGGAPGGGTSPDDDDDTSSSAPPPSSPPPYAGGPSDPYGGPGGAPGGGTSPDDDDDDGGGGKIVCTAMNQAYGFGSFRQAIWLAHSRDMAPEYQAGYHAIFQPLVTYGYGGVTKPRKFVRNILEGIARRRTADIWMQKKGKRHPIGRIERAFWEPVCYAVGRIVLCLKK